MLTRMIKVCMRDKPEVCLAAGIEQEFESLDGNAVVVRN